MTYIPNINDYVNWKTKKNEGWVYFKCDDYITIETMNTALYIVWIECWYCVIVINGMNWSTLNAVKILEIMGKGIRTKSN
jgi:hypothetical protein